MRHLMDQNYVVSKDSLSCHQVVISYTNEVHMKNAWMTIRQIKAKLGQFELFLLIRSGLRCQEKFLLNQKIISCQG